MVKTGLVEAIDSLVPLGEHLATFRVWGILETDIQEKDKNKAKNDKTKHGNGKSVKEAKSHGKRASLGVLLPFVVWVKSIIGHNLISISNSKFRAIGWDFPSVVLYIYYQTNQISKEKSKEKGVAGETTTRPTKGVIMKEAVKPVNVKGKDQFAFDEEVARRLEAQMQAEYEEEERVARQREEEGELTIEKRSKLFVELMNKRKKHFAKLRAKEIRRKPPTKAQKRNQMCSYLRNMANYKHSQLKNKIFKEIQTLFDNTMKWIDSFVPMDSEVVEGSKMRQKEGVCYTTDDIDLNVGMMKSFHSLD
ncbi:hypothetical protein Tco_0424947 [Tanacetum coccineum]